MSNMEPDSPFDPVPEVRKFLVLSTGRLNPSDADWLKARAEDASAYTGRYGFFAHAMEDVDNLGHICEDETRPANLTKIFIFAIRLGCDYVLFDADAE